MALRFSTEDKAKEKVLGLISDMKYHDLKKACIVRGMDFDILLAGDFPSNSNWLLKHWDDRIDNARLKSFDIYMDAKLKERGYKKKNPLRQFKQMTPPESEEKPEAKKLPKVPEKPKIKREKDDKHGIYKGTKKDLVYTLSEKLYNQLGQKYNNKDLVKKFCNQVMEKVSKKFNGAANEKSIRIWMKRVLDTLRK